MKAQNFCLPFILLGVMLSTSAHSSADCMDTNNGIDTMHTEEISLINDRGKIFKIESLIADDRQERASGYQHICQEVINNSTILFVYSNLTNGRFHMQNVKSPLDIGFFDSEGKLVTWMRMETYDDGNSRLYTPGQPFQYALEARPGYYKENNLTSGATRILVSSIYDNR